MSQFPSGTLFHYWGKAGKSAEGDETWHPLVYHSLDVAAVADRLLARNTRLLRRLAELTAMSPPVLAAWMRFFIALHDLGKFSSAFQRLRRDLAPERAKPYIYTVRHDTLGYLLWNHRLGEKLLGEGWWVPEDPAEADYLPEVFDQWILAVTGHHGQPPKTGNDSLHRHFADSDVGAALEYARQIATFLLSPEGAPLSLPAKALYDRIRHASWWIAGITVLADWLGSNRDFFPFQAGPMRHTAPIPMDQYWHGVALPAANHALDIAGLLPSPATGALPFEDLFRGIPNPTPLQAECLELVVGDGPQLFLVEDMTGAGKTEAAFVLLNRLLDQGGAVGAYLALPTMATANAMYRRTSRIYRRLFATEASPPSLVLAHGSRNLNDGYCESVLPKDRGDGEYDSGDTDASARCNAWIAERSKLSLLAQMGVGTIDQALLAVLTSRHQSLRLLGLMGKVLVVDEVHASDAYMHRLLCELLALHASAGGSAILLSATLPHRMRDELVTAFCSGTEQQPPVLTEDGYPLLTHINRHTADQLPVDTRHGSDRELEFVLVPDEETVLDWVKSTAEAGACVAWIRNSVADAMATLTALSERMDSSRIQLFHARFAMGDRLRIEDRILDGFGPDSGPDSRRGRVVVATQVIEQSLDLDFDEMVTDLAPIDLLLQRAGRLRRHRRDHKGNLVDGDDQRGPATLHVLAPDPDTVTDGDWYARLFPHAAPVYPDHGQLWLTARLLKDHGRIQVPRELRGFIEYVFGDDAAVAVPVELDFRSTRAAGQRSADASLARFNSIRPAEGYRHSGGEWWDESHTPTRLGEPTTTVRLARWNGEILTPWSSDPRHPWAMSEVKVRHATLSTEADAENQQLTNAIKEMRSQWGNEGAKVVLIPLMASPNQWRGKACTPSGELVNVLYGEEIGLLVSRGENNSASIS